MYIISLMLKFQPFFLRRDKISQPGQTIATGQSSLAKGDEAMDKLVV